MTYFRTRPIKAVVFKAYDEGKLPRDLWKDSQFRAEHRISQRTLYYWFEAWQDKTIDSDGLKVRIDRELFERLSVYCEVHQLSKKQVAVRAIEIWLAQQEQPDSEASKKEAAPAKDAA